MLSMALGARERTNYQHRRMMAEYQECTSKSAREEYAKAYATRWSELVRLPYFDMCRMIVVDPMHNLFLGECRKSSILVMCSRKPVLTLFALARGCENTFLPYMDPAEDFPEDERNSSTPRDPRQCMYDSSKAIWLLILVRL